MKKHPYLSLPHKAFWNRSVAKPDIKDVDPVGIFDLRINPETKVATAGSCFAQHIARHLQKAGFNYYVVEQGHPILSQDIREKHNYGVYSARYGNIYTTRQLIQLFRRAYGTFVPVEDAWIESDGSVRDPFRPTVQPRGYISVEEMHADRRQHLAAVREMFETTDVFVFTLGLTEFWMSRQDGAVFPLCPGVEGGTFDSDKYVFHNQTVLEVVEDLTMFVEELRMVNKNVEVILTVSPVPLMATAEPGAHVLSATTYSKSVLRCAAEIMRQKYLYIHYFPSYEIIIGTYTRGCYFAKDLRGVTEEGVSHVMRLFLKHAASIEADQLEETKKQEEPKDDFLQQVENLVQVECDEIALDDEASSCKC